MAKMEIEVDWVCEDCYWEWGEPQGVQRPCPRCRSRHTYWKEYIDHEIPEDTEHAFVSDPESPHGLYCQKCGASETDHRV